MRPLASFIRTIPDHPSPGIQFRDITTLLLDPIALRRAVDGLAAPYLAEGDRGNGGVAGGGAIASPAPDLVVGIEARGFIFATAVAYQLGAGFVPLRKPGKLPGATRGRDFELEYGRDRIEVHEEAIRAGGRVLIVDDLVATGGTAEAAVLLVRELGAEVVECAFVVSLPDLAGARRLEKLGCRVRALCEFAGD